MGEVIVWWLVLELLGLAALPLGWVVMRRLPDRGYAFAKSLPGAGGLLYVADQHSATGLIYRRTGLDRRAGAGRHRGLAAATQGSHTVVRDQRLLPPAHRLLAD